MSHYKRKIDLESQSLHQRPLQSNPVQDLLNHQIIFFSTFNLVCTSGFIEYSCRLILLNIESLDDLAMQ